MGKGVGIDLFTVHLYVNVRSTGVYYLFKQLHTKKKILEEKRNQYH